jgi:hypothetical protein
MAASWVPRGGRTTYASVGATTGDHQGGTMSDHIEQPETDDVEGHFQAIDDEGRASLPQPARVPVTDDDDVEGHVLDLDIERKR